MGIFDCLKERVLSGSAGTISEPYEFWDPRAGIGAMLSGILSQPVVLSMRS